jgi:CysZ protein
MITDPNNPPIKPNFYTHWVPIYKSVALIFNNPRILFLSLLLIIITLAMTWFFYQISAHYISQFAGRHFLTSPDPGSIWGWIKYQSWSFFKWIFLLISKLISFYIALLLAYSFTTPGYAFLSDTVEKIHACKTDKQEDGFSLQGIYLDLVEGCKIGILGLCVTCIALFANFLPGFGQILTLLLYVYYSCLMFIDYPASRRRWSLGKKTQWLIDNWYLAFRLGLLPAIISMIPIFNIFLMALLFPLLTVHSTLNFSALEPHANNTFSLKNN